MALSSLNRLRCYLQEEKYKIEEKTIRDLSEVIKEIDRRTMARVRNTKNVSEEEILLDFYSSKYPDLQFVDLPGFTKVRLSKGNVSRIQTGLEVV